MVVRRRWEHASEAEVQSPLAKLLSFANLTCRLPEFRISSIQVLEKRRRPSVATIGGKNSRPLEIRPSVNLTAKTWTLCVITYLTHHMTYSRVTWSRDQRLSVIS